MHDHPNAYFSFYNKGEIVSALLDLTIRRVTDGEKSLDDAMRLLWQSTESRAAAWRKMRARGRAHRRCRHFFAHVDGTDPLPYAETLPPWASRLRSRRVSPTSPSWAKLKMW
jgi:predicted metalloprotease with PDZ domain